jgi:hypothetical protein
MIPGQRFRHRNSFNPQIVTTWRVLSVRTRDITFAVDGLPDTLDANRRVLTHRQAERAVASGQMERLA